MTITHKSISEQLYETLRTEIISGNLKPGERVVEAEIAKKYGVSNTPVREAFSLLCAQGLLTTFPYCGTYVTVLSVEDARELTDFRIFMEAEAAAKAFDDLTCADADYLESLCIKADEMHALGDDVQSIEYDIQFHEYLLKKCGSKLILEIWGLLRNRVALFQLMTRPYNEATIPLLIDRHRGIIEAIRNKDLSALQKALTDHLKVSLTRGGLTASKEIVYK